MADFPDSWDEFCLIGIKPKGGTFVYFDAMVQDINDFNWMTKDIETRVLVNGGRAVRRVPHDGPEGITMKVIPVNVARGNEGIAQWFHPQSSEDSTQPITVDNTLDRDTFQVVILWTTQLPDGNLNADDVPDSDEAAERIQILNAYLTNYKPDFSDKTKSAEITFKWAPFQKDGTRNKIEESTDGSAQLSAVESFS